MTAARDGLVAGELARLVGLVALRLDLREDLAAEGIRTFWQLDFDRMEDLEVEY